MTLEAGFVDRSARLKPAQREIRHRIVTIGAGEIVALMRRTRPENALSAAVAVEAHAVLIGDGLQAPA